MDWKKVEKNLFLLLGYLTLMWGLYTGIIIITGGFTLLGTLVDCLFPALAAYSFLFFPIVVIIIMRLQGTEKSRYWILPIAIGTLVISLNVLPLTAGVQTPITDGDAGFKQAFGDDYIDQIPEALKSNFLSNPFDFSKMYNNYEEFDCNIQYNQGPYLTTPVYNDKFYFDWYYPKTGTAPFPTIINIHGGAWVLGNKGFENLPQVSKYLATQGYNVLDVQYGLMNFPEDEVWANDLLGSVQNVLGRQLTNGTYTMKEQIIHIVGYLTDYLVSNADTYMIDKNNIYVMGRSAGGHLTACFLGYKSTYKDVFNQELKLQGLIPFYGPSNITDLYETHSIDPLGTMIDLASFMQKLIGGTPQNNPLGYQEVSPVYMVDENAPPVLILHGSNDNLVPLRESYQLKMVLEQKSHNPVIMIEFPYAGHAYDFSFNSPGGQISLYYIERFLAATRFVEA